MKKTKVKKSAKGAHEEKLRLSLSPKIVGWLKELATYGIYGKDMAEVAERFICDGIHRLLEPGGLLREPPPVKSSAPR